MSANFDEFMKELTALSAKYGIAIAGCGCCGSPALQAVTDFHGYFYDVDSDEGHSNLDADVLDPMLGDAWREKRREKLMAEGKTRTWVK